MYELDHPRPTPRRSQVEQADRHKLSAIGGLSALSLDALSSVAYGPEAIVLALVAAGVGAVRWTLPITVAIAALLLLLVVSYSQVIAVHPDGGGAYAVAKSNFGRRTSLLAAASLVVDYVLTVAVSLAAGAASLGSLYPWIARHLLATCLVGLVVLTAINLVGVAESAKVLMVPTVVFVVSIVAVIVVGLFRSRPVAVIGIDPGPIHATEALSAVLILKAFAAGCSALTGVEAIANGVPAFKAPAVRRAQRTEIGLGVILGALLVGLAVLIKVRHAVPRDGVTILAQLSAGAFGTGWPFYVCNLAVTAVLLFAANTSFGGLPVLMSLLSRDHRLPHLFGLRAEKPVYRYGVVALALLVAILLVVVGSDTHRLLPLFAVGVFIGFTISQAGLVRRWLSDRPHGWLPRAMLNGAGALLTALAATVFFASKFSEGAWLLLILIPALMLLFGRVEGYYVETGRQLGIGEQPPPLRPPAARLGQLVVVPVTGVNRLTSLALDTALRMGGEVHPVFVDVDHSAMRDLCAEWERWQPGLELLVLPSPHRSLVAPVVGYVRHHIEAGREVVVLLAEVQPRHRRQEILHNQRGVVLAAALRARTDAVVATVALRLH